MLVVPEVDPASPLQFVINAATGSGAADTTRALIETALRAAGRRGELRFSRTAVVAVGGDGTLNTVAQAAHALGCVMGVVPLGTFNYFARTHGIPADPAEAARGLLGWTPAPVRVAAVNERVFLVNASLGLYPELLEDREAYKARFGRNRWVAFWAASATLLRAQRKLRLHIEQGAMVRDVRALTLFVGNNRLQLEQWGVQAQGHAEIGRVRAPEQGRVTAVMLRPIGTLSMLRLMLHGAMGTLGEAQSVERFEFEHMVVRPTRAPGRRGVKVAYDGEVARMRPPLAFRVLDKPLHLLMPRPHDTATDTAIDTTARREGTGG
jgi:diacylglycerol kinase family enzyme